MCNHVLDSLTSRFQILTRIEVARVFNQVFTNRSGHCQTQVSVDVDFANTEGASFQEHIFGNALCTINFAAVFVAFFNKRGDNGGSTMENQREVGEHVGDFFQTSEVQFRFTFKFVCAVASADSDSQGVNASTFNKFYCLVRVSVGSVFSINFNSVFYACQFAKFCFNYNASIVSVVYYTFGQFNIIFKGVFAAVNHNGGEATIDASFADFKIFTVVKVQANGQAAVFNCSFHQFHQVDMASVFTSASGNLQNQGSLFNFCCFYDTLDDFHVVYVESTNSIFTFIGFFKHFSRCY